MTICVAAMAAKSKAIVMIADKAISYGDDQPMMADIGIRKILPVGKTGWHTLIAGNPSFAREVIDRTVEFVTKTDNKRSMTAAGDARMMMLCMKEAYKNARKQLVQDKILSPYLLDESKLQSLPDDYSAAIYGAMSDLKTNCSLLVCGFDAQDKPHIFSITAPGLGTNHDIPGFHAAGVGRDAAIGKLYEHEINTSDELDAALYEVFDAKATAELIQGVGYEWDCSILVANRDPVEITDKAYKAVEEILWVANASPFGQKWGKKLDKVAGWKATIKAFTDGILKPPSSKAKPLKKLTQRRKSTSQTKAGQP